MKEPVRKHLGLLILAVIAAAFMLAVICVYVKAGDYEDKFIPGTTINGIDVGDLTQDEAIALLNENMQSYSLTLTFADGTQAVLSAADMTLQYQDNGQVASLLEKQHRVFWFIGSFGGQFTYTIDEGCQIDDAALLAKLLTYTQFQDEATTPASNAHIEISDAGEAAIVPEQAGNRLITETAIAKIKEAAATGVTELSFTYENGDYEAPTLTSADEGLNTRLGELNSFLTASITLNLHDGTAKTLDRTTLKDWISVSDTDPYYYYIDQTAISTHVAEFVAQLAQTENVTYTAEADVLKDGQRIETECDPYGYTLDEEAEKTALYNEVMSSAVVTRTPNYSSAEAERTTELDTYIELSIEQQHVWFYKDGELILDTDCVTGLATDPDMATPTGVYSVYWKAKDKNLVGQIDDMTGEPEYVSFVNFFIAFNGNIGFHDASWRNEFGGEIYKSTGSHGCVNMEYASAETIYENAEIGTVVYVY